MKSIIYLAIFAAILAYVSCQSGTGCQDNNAANNCLTKIYACQSSNMTDYKQTCPCYPSYFTCLKDQAKCSEGNGTLYSGQVSSCKQIGCSDAQCTAGNSSDAAAVVISVIVGVFVPIMSLVL